MKKLIIALVAASTVAAFAMHVKCGSCNGTGWKGSQKCIVCGGDGDTGS